MLLGRYSTVTATCTVDFPGPLALLPEMVKANESAPLKPGFDW